MKFMNRSIRVPNAAVVVRCFVVWIACFLVTKAANAAVVVTLVSPSENGAVVGRAPTITVSLATTYDIASVHATIDGVGGDLSVVAGNPSRWSGTIDISSLPRGAATLTVQATDVFASTGSVTAQVFHSNEPSLTVLSPSTPYFVARPTVHIATQCQDDDPAGCTTTTTQVFAGLSAGSPSKVAEGTGDLELDISLAAYEGSQVSLRVSATDSDGQQTNLVYGGFVESNPSLIPVATVPGSIVGADDTHIFYLTPGSRLIMRDRISLADTELASVDPMYVGNPMYVAATPSGAIFFSFTGSPYETWRWRNGTLTLLARQANTPPILVSGDYVAYLTQVNRVAHNAAAGTDQTLSGIGTYVDSYDVWKTGEVVYEQGGVYEQVGHILRYRFSNGAIEQLTGTGFVALGADGGVPISGNMPLYDGQNVVFMPGLRPCDEVDVFTSGHVEIVRNPTGSGPCLYPRYHVAVGGGFVAYLQKSATSGVLQLWMRAPDGTRKNVAPLAQPVMIDAMNESGQAMIKGAEDPTGVAGTGLRNGSRMYLADWNRLPRDVISGLAKSAALSNGWHVMLGSTLFKYDADGGGDSGVPPIDGGSAVDASLPDAGLDASGLMDGSTGAETRPDGSLDDAGANGERDAMGDVEPGADRDGTGAAGDDAGGVDARSGVGGNGGAGGALGGSAGTAGAIAGSSSTIGSPPADTNCGCRIARAERDSGYLWLGASLLALTRRRRRSRDSRA
jgi:hypothetical protein